MQALSGIIGQITQGMGGQTGQGLMGLLGMGENIFSKIMQWRAMSQAKQQQEQLQKLISNPSLLSARIRQATQPLDQNLTRTVTDQTLADLATRGLNPQTAPGTTQQAVAQALAPYEQQNVNAATQMIMQTLGLPFESAMALAKQWGGSGTDTSSIWKNLFSQQGGTFDPSVGGVSDPALGTISGIPSSGGVNTPDPTAPDITLPGSTPPIFDEQGSQPTFDPSMLWNPAPAFGG